MKTHNQGQFQTGRVSSLPVKEEPFIRPGPFYSLSASPPLSPQPTQRMPPTPEKPRIKKQSKAKKGQGKIVAAVVAAVMVLVLVLVVGFVLSMKSAPDVTLYKVGSGNVQNTIGGGGIIFPRQQLDISYPVAERVISVLVKAGDRITTNQSLIQLDPSQLNAAVTQASNDLAAAQAYLDSVTASRNSLMIAQAQQQYNVAKNKYEALVAESASPTLHHGRLISPMDGVVTAVNVNAGEVFSANTPLLTIMDESSVIVHVKIPLSALSLVRVGQSADLIPSALPQLDITGTVVSIVPKADPQTDTFEVWVEVPNKDMLLLPGMSAFVRIQAANKQAFVLPRLTVLNADHEPTVFVVHGSQAYLQRVHVIGRAVEMLYVDKGVAEGDRVVLVGNDRLHNGDNVHIVRVEA